MLLIIGNTNDQSQTEHFFLACSTELSCYNFFSINNGEENKLMSAGDSAKVDIRFL